MTNSTGNVQLDCMFAHASYSQTCIWVYMCHLNGRIVAQLLRTHAMNTWHKPLHNFMQKYNVFHCCKHSQNSILRKLFGSKTLCKSLTKNDQLLSKIPFILWPKKPQMHCTSTVYVKVDGTYGNHCVSKSMGKSFFLQQRQPRQSYDTFSSSPKTQHQPHCVSTTNML